MGEEEVGQVRGVGEEEVGEDRQSDGGGAGGEEELRVEGSGVVDFGEQTTGGDGTWIWEGRGRKRRWRRR